MRLRVLFFCLNQGGHHGKQELSWNRKSRNPFAKIRNPVYLFPHYCILRRSAATGAVISGHLAAQRPPVI
ncbi:hypothetical protein, partial [Intestinimonas butyriciproducens]|uniref:hypothetical protein n=1 Tax=Intestinimonas butyriciproducens TaxID=1297617 RepID=UPI00321B3134